MILAPAIGILPQLLRSRRIQGMELAWLLGAFTLGRGKTTMPITMALLIGGPLHGDVLDFSEQVQERLEQESSYLRFTEHIPDVMIHPQARIFIWHELPGTDYSLALRDACAQLEPLDETRPGNDRVLMREQISRR